MHSLRAQAKAYKRLLLDADALSEGNKPEWLVVLLLLLGFSLSLYLQILY